MCHGSFVAHRSPIRFGGLVLKIVSFHIRSFISFTLRVSRSRWALLAGWLMPRDMSSSISSASVFPLRPLSFIIRAVTAPVIVRISAKAVDGESALTDAPKVGFGYRYFFALGWPSLSLSAL